MAALNTLRTKGSIILTAAIGISLLAFLLGDGQSMLNSKKIVVGTINGNEVTVQEYAMAIDKATSIRQFMTNQSSLTQQESEQVQMQVWYQFMTDLAANPAYNSLGLDVSDAELLDMVNGENISPVITQLFSDPSTGAFNKEYITQFVSSLSYDPSGTSRNFWNHVEKQAADDRLNTKFASLIQNGLFTTDLQVDQAYANNENNYTLEYVTKNISSIADDQVNVTDAALKAYYDKHIARFKTDKVSEVEYVSFDIVPSQKDYQDAEKNAFKVAKELSEADDIEQYVNYISEQRFNAGYYNLERLPDYLQKLVANAKVGDTFDPRFENDAYSIERVADIKLMPDSIELRSVIVSPTANLDSLINVIKKSANGFDDVVASSSLVEANMAAPIKMDAGSLSAVYSEKLVPSKKGDVFVFDAQGAKQIVKVISLDKKVNKYQIGQIFLSVNPSNETETDIYNQATNFLNSINNDGKTFEQAVADNQYIKRNANVNIADRNFAGIDNSRELVRWAFTAAKGGVSHVVNAGDVNIVAYVKNKLDKGTAPFESVKEDIRQSCMNKMKMDMAVAELSSASSLDALAQQLDTEVGTISDVNFSMVSIPGIGLAPEVVGAMTTLGQGVMSKGIPAGTAAAVIKVSDVAANEGMTKEKIKIILDSENQSYLAARIGDALQSLIVIDDQRVIYY